MSSSIKCGNCNRNFGMYSENAHMIKMYGVCCYCIDTSSYKFLEHTLDFLNKGDRNGNNRR